MLALPSEYGAESARLAADERILRTKAQGVGCRLRADRKDAVKTRRASKPNSKQFSPERRDIFVASTYMIISNTPYVLNHVCPIKLTLALTICWDSYGNVYG